MILHDFLEWDDLERLSTVTATVRRLRGDQLHLYKRIRQLGKCVKQVTGEQRDALWWDCNCEPLEFPESMWPPLDSPLLLGVFYAMLIKAFPCILGRITDGKKTWLCLAHPGTLALKQLPHVDGKLYYRMDSAQDSTELVFSVNFFTHATTVVMTRRWWNSTDPDVHGRIDCTLMQKLFVSEMDLFNASAVMRVITS